MFMGYIKNGCTNYLKAVRLHWLKGKVHTLEQLRKAFLTVLITIVVPSRQVILYYSVDKCVDNCRLV